VRGVGILRIFGGTTLAAILVVLLASSPATATVLTGSATIVDGDTLEISGVRVRLFGVDAPETDQVCLNEAGRLYSCGIAAREFIKSLVHGAPISCVGDKHDRYKRLLAICYLGNDDLNAKLVEAGWALAYVQYSNKYVSAEIGALSRSAGLWAGGFFAPWEWRHRDPKTEVKAAKSLPIDAQKLLLSTLKVDKPPVPGCEIKGNVSRNGGHIYYVPGHRLYGRVRMNRAERRWFCTEDEAISAGWRKAK
jgi:endonuclease YncB( thermonuclease family)